MSCGQLIDFIEFSGLMIRPLENRHTKLYLLVSFASNLLAVRVRRAPRRRALAAALAILAALSLVGCGGAALGVVAGITLAGQVAGAAHSFYQVGGDIIAATSVACADLPEARAKSAWAVAVGLRPLAAHAALERSAAAICDWASPDNPAINVATPAWLGRVTAKLEAPVP